MGNRIVSVAAVQRLLQTSTLGESIALIPYLSALCDTISRSTISDKHAITIEVRGKEGNADRRKAESLGLPAPRSVGPASRAI
jgi:two-component sensor histidine kinase